MLHVALNKTFGSFKAQSAVCGVAKTGKIIHVQSSYPSRPLVKIITV